MTSFAPRAIDRGLAALLVSYVRLLGAEFNENSKAGMVTGNHPYFAAAIDELAQRAEHVTGSHEVAASVREALGQLKEQWLQKVATTTGGASLGYKSRRDGRTIGLLKSPGLGDLTPFTCLNSLRDVEPSINLILDDRSLGDQIEHISEEIVETEGKQ